MVEVNSKRWLSIEPLEGETWKQVDGYGGFYEVSNLGRVRSKERITEIQPYCHIVRKPRILKAQFNGYYYRVVMSLNGKSRQVLIHRLVAETFIPNPKGYDTVNHKDENGKNNHVNNLEWCTMQYNQSYGTKCMRHSLYMVNEVGRAVTQYTKKGEPIASYRSIMEASRKTGISYTGIHEVCIRGKQKTAGGYVWRYAEEDYGSIGYKRNFKNKDWK